MPQVSAKSWIIFDAKKNVTVFSKNPEAVQEIASLTKIMTAHLVIQLCQELEIDMKLTYCRVSKLATQVGGTSAFLKEGLRFSIYDLLHGLMLPSGNDAALCLSEHFGRYLMLLKAKANSQAFTKVCEMDPFDSQVCHVFSKKFCRRMNKEANQLKLTATNYSNPHGLCDKANKSNVSDQARMSAIAMKNPIFREIVNKKHYTTFLVADCRNLEGKVKLMEYWWRNSNKLLAN